MKKISFIKKISIPYLVLLAFLLIAISYGTSRYFEDFILSSWKNELVSGANLAAGQLSTLHFEGLSSSDLSNLTNQLSTTTGDRVTIILPDGLVVGESSRDPSSMENHLSRPEIQSALAGTPETVIRTSATLHKRFLYAASPILSDGTIIGVIRLAKPLDELDLTLKNFILFLVLLSSLGLLAGMIFMFVLSSKKINPLQKLSEKIRLVSLEDLHKIDVSGRKDELGSIAASFNFMVDKVTNQYSEIKEEQAQRNLILDNMTDGVILVDENGKVILFNTAAQKMFMFDEETAIGVSLVEVVRQFQVIDLWKKCAGTKIVQYQNIQLPVNQVSLHVTATPIKGDSQRGILLLFQDLTLVQKLQTVRQDFISNVSHELRTPLTSLKLLTETIQDGAINDKNALSRFLQQMNAEIDNLIQIVQELLELSKIESGKVPIIVQNISPLEIISRSVDSIQLQADRSKIKIINNVSSSLPEIKADGNRIHQVVLNLLHNAIKFTPQGGKITIDAKEEPNLVVFSISDTGVGMHEKDLARIFERFYKADRSRTTEGTGLGLSIARHIIEEHGGKIWADSKIGAGSTFYFSIPKSSKEI